MKLYEIDERIESVLTRSMDPDTGEVLGGWQNEIDTLSIERSEKVLNIGVAIRMERAEVNIIDGEIKRLQGLKTARCNHADRMKEYLSSNLDPGDKYKDHRVSLYWMHTKSVKIDDDTLLAPKYQRVITEPDKKAIKLAIESGLPVDGARLVDNDSLVVR